MNQNLSKLFGTAAVFAILAAGCNTAEVTPQESNTPSETAQTASQPQKPDRNPTEMQTASEDIPTVLLSQEPPSPASDLSALFTDRDRRDTYDPPIAVITCTGDAVSIEGTGASADGTTVTIADEGVYRITGTLNNGQILVNSQGKIQLLLDGADLSCSDSAPIYVQQAKKCFLTLAEGSENTVSDGTAYVYANETDNEPDAAIFSADTLTINGSGTLTVSGNYNEGITCKDDLIITSGNISITSVGNGIKGKDHVAIAGGVISVTAGADGIKSNNTDAGTGFVYIEGGTITVDAQEDAIQAESECILTGGTLQLKAGGGSVNAQPQMNQGRGDFGAFTNFGNFADWKSYEETTSESDTSVSTKALKAGTLVHITGGACVMDSADDGLHSNGDLYIGGGTMEIAAAGDGIHADGLADIADGTICITQSSEGIEAAGIRISGGTIDVTASDDGFNASDGTAQGGMGTYSSGAALEISGGNVHINANGDGLDSNGDLLVNGGVVIVDGPTNSGNGALDGNGGIYCTGGTLIAAGSSGMAEFPKGSQNTAIITLDAFQQSGTVIRIADADGNEIFSHAPEKQFNSIIVSSPDFKDGETYTVTADDAEVGTFTVESVLSYIGEAGMMGGFGGRGDGGRGHRHDMQMPTDADGNIAMPEMPDGMTPPENMQMPTDADGNPVMPEMPEGGMMPPDGGFRGGMPEDFVVQ